MFNIYSEKEELEARRDFMRRRGYRSCNIAACNCNSWHGGHADQRLQEIYEVLGYQLTNGKTALEVIEGLVENSKRAKEALGDE